MTFLLIVVSVAAVAQTKSVHYSRPLTTDIPENAGMSSERLSRIDSICQKAIKNGDVPGMVALVARNGKIVYHKAFGLSDYPANKPMQKDDIFRIASQTKAITATAVMILWEEGRFRLDDPVSKYIPEFKNPQVFSTFNESDSTWTGTPANKEITIRHLLTHTSGIGYGAIDGDKSFQKIYRKAGISDLGTTEKITVKDNIRKLAKMPLHHNPGEKYTYGEGLDVLGYFVEVISGMPFDQFLKTRIFEPLGMNDTYFYLPDNKASRLVPIQIPANGKWVHYPVTFLDPDYPVKGAKSYFSGGAGLCSTAMDYATFLQMYLNGGELNHIRILSRTTVQMIMKNQFPELWVEKPEYYGLAFSVINEKGGNLGGMGSVNSFYWGGYFNTSYFADPNEKIIGILMKQTMDAKSDNTGWQYKILVESAIDD